MVVEVGGIVDVDVAAGGEVLELHPANATTQTTRAAVTPKPQVLLRNLCVMSPLDVPQHSRLKQAGHGGDQQSALAPCGHADFSLRDCHSPGASQPTETTPRSLAATLSTPRDQTKVGVTVRRRVAQSSKR